MAMAGSLEPTLRHDLLCHLAVAQLLSKAQTDGWARADRVVEVIRSWSRDNNASVDWSESVMLAHLSQKLAVLLWMLKPLRNIRRLKTLYTADRRLDRKSPIVRGIREVCAARLMR